LFINRIDDREQRQAIEIEPEKIVRTFNFIPESKGDGDK